MTAVGSLPGCQGGYPGIFDMVGNVSEWENSCDPATDAGPGACALRGGSYDYNFPQECSLALKAERTYAHPGIGFRCCASLAP